MSSKTLAGYLLVIGPILMLAIFIGVWDAVIGGAKEGVLGEAKIKANMEAGMENFSLTKIIAFLGGGSMLAMFLGYTFWARLLQGEGKKGTSLATIASIAIPVAAAGMMVSMDLNFAAARAWDLGDTSNALIVGAVAEYAGANFIGSFLMISTGFIGLAAVLQLTDKVSKSIGALLAAVSFVMFIMGFTPIAVGPIWMVWMVITVAAGVNLIIRQKA